MGEVADAVVAVDEGAEEAAGLLLYDMPIW
jgi:hypothetical protein